MNTFYLYRNIEMNQLAKFHNRYLSKSDLIFFFKFLTSKIVNRMAQGYKYKSKITLAFEARRSL